MRICILTHGSMPFGRQYARAFQARGHEVAFFSLSPMKPIPGVPCQVFSGEVPARSESRFHYLFTIPKVRRALAALQPDLLFAMYLSSAGLVAALTAGCPIMASALGSDINTRIHSRAWRLALRFVVRRSAAIHSVSADIARCLKERLGAGGTPLIVSPIGVDTGFLACVDPALRPGAGAIICTRSHKPEYDMPTLVRALALLKARGVPFQATFTAVNPMETPARVARAGLQEQVRFLPGYAYSRLPALLAEQDVYVSCSLEDGTSQSLLEAMSTGLFPVVSDIPANRPWLRHGETGLLFRPGDAEDLARCLQAALGDPGLRAAASPRNRERVLSSGDAGTEADRLLEAMQRCVDRQRSFRG